MDPSGQSLLRQPAGLDGAAASPLAVGADGAATAAGELRLRADGRELAAEAGEPLLQALLRHGFDLPHVCYHPSLGPIQTCDTCLVEADGELVRACATAVRDGMEVGVASPAARAAQVEATQRLLRNHELYCTVCENNNGDCALHETVERLAIEQPRYPFEPKPYALDDSNPFYVYDPDQCILCGRCVEVCQDVQVNETLRIDWERERPRVIWDDDVPIDQSSCVSCGQCVTVCPVNALMEKSMLCRAGILTGMPREVKRPLIDLTKALEPGFAPLMAMSDAEASLRRSDVRVTKTVCTYCGVGCSFDVWTRGREILKVQPRPEAPANGISTCVKGKFGWDFVNSPDRLRRPLVREGNRFREASWEEAVGLVARRLREIAEESGPDALAFIASSKCTNEEAFLLQKLARQVFGTHNIDNCSRYCQSPATMGLWRTVGYGGDAGSIRDIEQAELVLIVGSNTAESHPVLASRVKRAHKLFGQRLVVADLRRHEMARRADLWIHPEPGTDLVWLSAVTRYILDRGWEDRDFLEQRVNGLEEYRKSLEPFTLEFAERMSGVPGEQLVRVAEMIHEARSVCALWAMGVTQHQCGSDTATAISNLLLVTGNYGRPGTGAYPLRGHNNVQGTSDFGAMPNYLPGYQKVQDEAVRRRFEEAWGVRLPAEPGLDNHRMIDAIHAGKVRGMYLIGEEITLVDANANYVREALRKLDFLVVQDIFFSETARYADVVLPASPSLEKEGTFTNTERRIQRLYRVMEPLADSRPDWEILQMVANALGAGWRYAHPSEVMAEAARLVPIFAGVSYERLEGYRSLQWPVAPDGRDSPLLYVERFNFPDGRARLFPLGWREPLATDEEFDLHVNNGRLLEHFHEGNLTYRSDGIRHKVPQAFVEVSPELARERGLSDGDRVRLVSRWGAVKVSVLVTDRVQGRELYLPMNGGGEAAVNLLTSSLADKDTNTPAYKELPVRLEKLEPGDGRPPLPGVNSRFGRPQPQRGVEVERKWRRPDYTLPGAAPGRPAAGR
ncbi:MAG: formate dehydrogenase subunit alpha [Bacillota bacterium]|nr:formate dehydrogenase subunit alpha [Bacillota bacterium]